MQIGVLGINHKLANLKLRETFAKVCERRFHPQKSTHGEHSFVLLSTCNRTEIYFYSEELAETHSYLLSILRQELNEDFDHKLYSYFGFECFYHLSRVTVGLDSACLAETEIQGQVKIAYEQAIASQKLPPELHYLFQKSLNIGKQIRTELNLGRGLPGLPSAVIETGANFFPPQSQPKILFIGASAINEKILATKKFKDVFLMTRSYEKGLEFQTAHGVTPVAWKPDSWHLYDWIICGTRTSDFIIKRGHQPITSKKLILDLSVPRNVDPQVTKDCLLTLFNIDQLNKQLHSRQRDLKTAIESADQLVVTLAERHMDIYQQKRDSKLKILALTA